MKFKYCAAAFLVLSATVLASVNWPHSKQYPCKIVKIYSPTEYYVYFTEEKKYYRLRLAHVAPIEKKNTKKDKYVKENYKTAMEVVTRELKQENLFVEFEGDDIQYDGDSQSKIVGYLFLSPKRLFNCMLLWQNSHVPDYRTYSSYQQENGKDSKGKKDFDRGKDFTL